MLKRVLLGLGVMAFSSAIAVAAETSNTTTTSDNWRMSLTGQAGEHSVSNWHAIIPAGRTIIFSNLNTHYPDGTYVCCGYAYPISGSSSASGKSFWGAAAFTPSADATASEVALGLGLKSGTNKVYVTLNADSHGHPGAVLATGVVASLPALESCCALGHAKFKTPVPVTAGSQYWVVVLTNGSDADTYAGWYMNSTEQINPLPCAINVGNGGWNALTCLPGPAFAVY
jgi:hypothetical protein